jgi:DNA-binding PadR family transcriptional regulator
MLYHHLKKLDKAGWVSATVEQQGVRPPRQVYQLTPEGREELDRWLGDPVGRTREIRLEFLVKLFFAQRLHPNLAGELVEHQRDTLVRNLASLKAQQQSMAAGGDADDRDRSFSIHVLELRAAQTEAALSWLDDLIASERKGSAG